MENKLANEIELGEQVVENGKSDPNIRAHSKITKLLNINIPYRPDIRGRIRGLQYVNVQKFCIT